jgi:hypothetical protein
MSTYTDDDLRQLKATVEENNKMLRGLLKRARMGTFFFVMRWVIVIGIAIGAYTFIQPYVEQITETYYSIVESANTLKDARNSVTEATSINIPELLKNLSGSSE